jgi:hypothetical protein
MSIYTWPPPGQDEGSITGVRLADQIRARVGSQLDGYNFDTAKDAALAELLGSAAEVFDVRAFGAKGDDSADEIVALDAAVAAAVDVNPLPDSEGSIVVVPAGNYRISRDWIIPEGVTVVGAGQTATRIRRHASAVITDAMVVLNGDPDVFATALRFLHMQIHCIGAAPGLLANGLNEGCMIDGIHVLAPQTFGIKIRPSTLPATHITQNVFFGQMRVTSPAADTDAIVLNSVRRCTFGAISVDTGATPGFEHGIRTEGSQCSDNLFLRTHLEDCKRPILMGEDSPDQNNRFIGLAVTNPTQTPVSQTYGGLTGTMAVVQARSTGAQAVRNTIEQFHVNYDFDYDFVDAEDGFNVPSTGSIERRHTKIEVRFDENGNRLREWDSRVALPAYETASLPAAGAVEDQSICIEDAGAGGAKLAIYVGAARYQIPAVVGNGVATLANGNTTVAVTHGLGVTPDIEDISVTPIELWGAATQYAAHTPTSTQFTIEVDQDPGQDVDFAWTASVQ